MKQVFNEHLSKLRTEFGKFIPETEQHYLISDLFNPVSPSNFTYAEQKQFIDLSSDSAL